MKQYALLISLSVILLQACNQKKKSDQYQSSYLKNIDQEIIMKAKAIHDKVITIDTHCDINIKNFTDSINYTQDLDTQVTLPKMKKGGLDVAWFIVYTPQDSLTANGLDKAYSTASTKFFRINKFVNKYAGDQIELALHPYAVRQIHAKGKKVAMIGIENGFPIGTDLDIIRKFYSRGARYMSLTHQGHNQLSDSNTGEEDGIWKHNGLSDFGKKVIKEMNRIGMMIDVSHPSKEAMRQMIEITKAPLIASHSAARALCDHSRNLDDEQLQWIKENGGVVQTVAYAAYLNAEKIKKRNEKKSEIAKEVSASMGITWMDKDQIAALSPKEKEGYYENYQKVIPVLKERIKNTKNLPPAVDLEDFVNHIDYMVEKMGIDHVGISSDFDGGGGIEGWRDASETLNVTVALVKRGYSEEEIKKLWGENLLRVMDQTLKVASNTQKKARRERE